MNSPFRRHRVMTPEFKAVWTRYEAANRAAAEQYEALPTSYHRTGEGSPCVRCHHRATRAKNGVCPTCRREESL